MKAYKSGEVPVLHPGQVYLIYVYKFTGHVLTLEGKKDNINDPRDSVIVFETLSEAEEFANNRIKERPDIECHIYDHTNQHITMIVDRTYRRKIKKPPLLGDWCNPWRWRLYWKKKE
jgi:hypothetical protein